MIKSIEEVNAMEKKEKNKKKPNKNVPSGNGKSTGSKRSDLPGAIIEPKGFSKGKPKEKKPKNDKRTIDNCAPASNEKPIKILSKPQNNVEKISRSPIRKNRNSLSNELTWENNPDYKESKTILTKNESIVKDTQPSSSNNHCDTPSQLSTNSFSQKQIEENLARFRGSQFPDVRDQVDTDIEIETTEKDSKKPVPVMYLYDEDDVSEDGDEFMVSVVLGVAHFCITTTYFTICI